MAKKKLNPQHEKFIQNRVSGMSQTEAYIAAGYAEKSARQNAHRLITNDYIQQEIKRRLDEIRADAEIHLASKALQMAQIETKIAESGSKEDFCSLSAAKDVLDRLGIRAEEKVKHSGKVDSNLVIEVITAIPRPEDDQDCD